MKPVFVELPPFEPQAERPTRASDTSAVETSLVPKARAEKSASEKKAIVDALLAAPAARLPVAKKTKTAAAKPTGVKEAKARIVATINGMRYHRDGCNVLRRAPSDHWMPLPDVQDAAARGLTPCRICIR